MAGSETTLAAAPSGDEIFELLGELRDAGFRIGIREHVIAQELALVCRPEDVDFDPLRLRNWLAPALCQSPEEQRELYRVFQTWWSRRAPARSSEPAAAEQKHSTADETIVDRSLPWKWILSFGTALVLVAAAVSLVDQRRHRDATGGTGNIPGAPAGTGPAESSPAAAGVAKMASPPARNVLSIVVNVVDRQGTPVPDASVQSEIRLSHGAAIGSAGFSPDGTLIVTASDDGTARVWDARTWQQMGAPLKHEGRINSAAFSPDGTRVVTASDDQTARVWDARSGQFSGARLQHTDRLNSATFSADGAQVVTASDDKTARVWDARTGQPLGAPFQHQGAVNSAAFSRDGARVVTASRDKTARLWDAQTGRPVGAPLEHKGWVYSAAFSADEARVVTASADSTARVWDARTGQPVGTPLQHADAVYSAAFSRDGARVVTASRDKTARLWDAQTGRPVGAPLEHKGWVYSAAFSADEARVVTASADSTARVWDARTGQPVGTPLQHGDWVFSAGFSPDSTRVVTASRDMTARVWNAATGQLLSAPLEHGFQVHSAQFSADGTRVVTTGDNTVRLWEARTGQRVGALLQHGNRITSAQFSRDGTRVVTVSADNTAQVWDAGTWKPVGTPLQHADAVYSAAFNHDGTRVVTGSQDKTARVWDARTGQLVGAPLQHADTVYSATFSHDGTRVVTASADNTARVWDAATGQPVGTPLQHADAVYSAAFNHDGTRVVTGSQDKTARVWDARTGQSVGAPLGHGGQVFSTAFRPDGHVLTASADRTVRVWDAATGQIVGTPLKHPYVVRAGSFDSDGNRFVAASTEGAIVWDTSSPPQTGRDGTSEVASSPAPKPQRVSVSHADYESAAAYPTDYGSGHLTLRAELNSKGSGASRWLLEHVDLLRLIGAVVPLLAAAIWTAWALYRRRLVLERRASTQAHDLAHVRLAEPAHRLYRGSPFVRARIEARRRQAAIEGELDADATIDRTIRHLGFFSPVFRPRSRLPAYVALVDRAGFHDQQARTVEEFLDGLREGGVAIDSYFFDRDPRLCTPASGGDGVYRSLWELSALHADHRLLLFGDGSGLADPATGRVAAWIDGLSPWSERALLTPVPACHWSAHELDLARSGFRVVPFTPAGLRLFLESLQPANLRPALLEWRAPYPPLIAEQPGRWQGRGRPRSEEIDALCWQLRAYLGHDGFRWLSSLAVYPSMDWFLTLYMGLGLRTAAGIPLLEEEQLLALTRLPWLRHGFMPDWLRLRLASELGTDDSRSVRELLKTLLRARLDSPGARFQLAVARPAAVPDGRRWRRFFVDLLRTEPPGSPLHDYVFVEFLLGRRPAKLQVPLPGGWRHWVYHRGLRSLGIRPTIVMPAAALLAVTATLSARPMAERLQASQTSATPSKITQTAWTPSEVTAEVPEPADLELAPAAAVAPANQPPAPCRQGDFDAIAGLTLQQKVDAFRAMSPKGSSTGRRDEQRMECLILSIDSNSLSRFKFDLEYDGDYKDLVEYVFHDIDNEDRQRNILAHFRTAPRESRVKVLTDVDDTMLANLVDRRYAKGTLYPGVVAFYDALKQEPFATTHVPVTTLSARPNPLIGIAEEASLRSVRTLTADRLSPSAQSGELKSSVALTRASNKSYLKRLSDRVPFESEDEIGQVKFANCQQFCAVFPEYQYVFVGDSGQADALTAQLLTNGQMAEGISRPLTTFIHDLRESSDDLRAVSPAFRRLSPDDLVGDPPAARRGVIVFRNYIHAATIGYLQRDTLGNIIEADELAVITRAALADFERIAATAPSRKTLERDYKADAERATALVAASGLAASAAANLRRTLDSPFWKQVTIQ